MTFFFAVVNEEVKKEPSSQPDVPTSSQSGTSEAKPSTVEPPETPLPAPVISNPTPAPEPKKKSTEERIKAELRRWDRDRRKILGF